MDNVQRGYNGNPLLKKKNTQISFSKEMFEEYVKCANDPAYFAEKYIKIVHVDHGFIPIELYEYQKEIIESTKESRRVAVCTSRQAGKCVSGNTKIKIRNKNTGEIKEVSIEEFYLKNKNGDSNNPNLSLSPQRKFVDSIDLSDWEVYTDSGWRSINAIHKTIEYEKYELRVGDNYLECADDHIVFTEDYEEIFVKNLKENDFVITENGPEKVVSVKKVGVKENMFDLSVDSDDQRYYTNNILSHNTTTAVVIILHYVLFNSYKTVALLANKGDSAREILYRVQLAFEALPAWLQQGVIEWNKGSVEFENGCKIIAAATSSSAIRGKSVSFLYIDETAFVENWDEFFASVFPTISSGKTTKILFTSTPNGLNHFYKTCEGAKENRNGYSYIEVPWQKVPGRDENWKQETLAAMDFDLQKFAQEFECAFLGSSGTLIDGSALKNLVYKTPLFEKEKISIYEKPEKGKTYTCIVDVSRGKGLDYSAFQIIDVSQMPYRQVCTFRDNMITPIDFANIIFSSVMAYNEAYTLIEINDIGQQVSEILQFDLEYENLLYTENAGRSGKRISGGFGSSVDKGIRTTKSVKAIGCNILKMLVEQSQLIINDFNTINELSTFSKKGVSYEAEPGCHDDLVMCLVLFGWLSTQPFFKDITDINTMFRLKEKNEEEIMESFLPFGFSANEYFDEIEDPRPDSLHRF